MSTVSNTSVKPTITVTPDSRFATTFLSTKYRDRAVAGEALMDKSTGELFIKRISDGKIVSFYQNKKMINNLALEFRFLLLNNEKFRYPTDSDTSFYISTNYDLVAINNETIYNLITDNVYIAGGPNDINKLTFKISGNSNGFFCNNTTRDIDKPIIEFLSNQYDMIFKNYTGTNEVYLQERNKFDNEKWYFNNSTIVYDVTLIKGDAEYTYENLKDYIRMNEESCVILPDYIYDDIGSFDYGVVTIKSIIYDKIHFMFEHKDEFGNIFTETFNKLVYNDNKIEVSEFNVIHFIDNINDIEIYGNENIIAFLDVAHIKKHMFMMDKIQSRGVTISDTKPDYAGLWFKPTT